MKNVLRWIAVLPASLAALFLSHIIFVFMNRNVIRNFIYGGEDSPFVELIVQVCASFMSAACFVFAGTYVSPSKKDISCLSLTVLLCVICAFGLGISLSNGTFTRQHLLEDIAAIVRAWVSYVELKSDDLNR